MTASLLGEVIGEREFHVVGHEGQRVIVRMGKPRPLAEVDSCCGDSAAFCPIQIIGPEFERTYTIRGVDNFQAMQYGLQLIGDLLFEIKTVSNIELRWEDGDPGDHGFKRS